MMVTSCALLLVAVAAHSAAASLSCPASCDKKSCEKPTQPCPFGYVHDTCGCCFLCGKGLGAECGGGLMQYGRCGVGLRCEISANSYYGRCVRDDQGVGTAWKHYPLENGPEKTVEKPSVPLAAALSLAEEEAEAVEPMVAESPVSALRGCPPPCTPRFCEENPRALCSATQTMSWEERGACGDMCATTVCRACYAHFDWTTSCKHCRHDDIDCIKNFGRCVRRNRSPKTLLVPGTALACDVPTC